MHHQLSSRLEYSKFFLPCTVIKQMEEVLLDLSPKASKVVDIEDVYIKKVLKPGDHIAVPMSTLSELCRPWHHGIYEGEDTNGEHFVIHMNGGDKASATIRRDSFRVFRGNNANIAIVQYDDADGDCGHEMALRAALDALKSSHEEVYNLIDNNCEHFATWCRTGRYVLNPDTDNVLNILYEQALRRTPTKYDTLFLGKNPYKLQPS
jgi:hypothetical protein